MDSSQLYKKLSGHVPQVLSNQNLAERLKHDEFFRLFSPLATEVIFSKAITKHYKARDCVYNRGDTEAFMGIVMSGRLRMSLTDSDGRSVLIGLVEAGEVFGETSLLDGLPRTTDAEADTDCTVTILKHEDFIKALHQHPEALFGIIRMLCHRLRTYLDTIDLIGLQNLERRLAGLLLRLAGNYGVEENGQIVIRSGLSQTFLGQKLATSRESINKQLKSFANDGLISLQGNDITLLNVEELQHIAG